MIWLYEAQKALEKAEDCLDDSAFNLSGGRTIVTVNRAYYAVYYCICCLLYTKNVSTKTHKGAQQKFGELFVKTGIFTSISAKWVSDAFELRQFGDYDLEATISEIEARQVLDQAQQFYEITQIYFDALLRNQKN
jgi:uncharacterized protein (UPF0332 family)